MWWPLLAILIGVEAPPGATLAVSTLFVRSPVSDKEGPPHARVTSPLAFVAASKPQCPPNGEPTVDAGPNRISPGTPAASAWDAATPTRADVSTSPVRIERSHDRDVGDADILNGPFAARQVA